MRKVSCLLLAMMSLTAPPPLPWTVAPAQPCFGSALYDHFVFLSIFNDLDGPTRHQLKQQPVNSELINALLRVCR